MNLTNNEAMSSDNGAGYKSEPNEMMYYPSAATDTMNQTTDSIFSALLDEQLGWNNEDLAFNVSDGKSRPKITNPPMRYLQNYEFYHSYTFEPSSIRQN
jgi:hypothetical protein